MLANADREKKWRRWDYSNGSSEFVNGFDQHRAMMFHRRRAIMDTGVDHRDHGRSFRQLSIQSGISPSILFCQARSSRYLGFELWSPPKESIRRNDDKPPFYFIRQVIIHTHACGRVMSSDDVG